MVAQGRKELGQVIDEYDESMRIRASKESQLSLDQTLKSHNWNRLMDAPIVKMSAYQQQDD